MTSSDMKYEDGFYFHSLPCPSGSVKSLIVILHGHGSHPDKFVKWAKKAQERNPDADVLVVRGPKATHATPAQKAAHKFFEDDDLYSWYGPRKRPSKKTSFVFSNVFNRQTVIGKLNRMLDSQLKQRGLRDKNLALIGFSMGGWVAVRTALTRKNECAAVVCHSGIVLPFTKAKRKPDTLMIMGDADGLFYAAAEKPAKKISAIARAFLRTKVRLGLNHDRSVKRLKKAGVPVEEKIFPGQGHRVTEESWEAASRFVAKNLKLKR